jgi:transposase
MARPYPQELRDRVLTACDRGMKTRQVARTFCVSESWVRRIKQRRREDGQTSPRPMGGATVIKIDLERLRELVQAQPDATLEELRQRLGSACHSWSVGLALRRLGLSLKKKRCTRRSRTGPMWPKPAPNGSRINPPGTSAA